METLFLLLYRHSNFCGSPHAGKRVKNSFTGDKIMLSLQDLLGQEQGNQAVSQISQSVGADPSLVGTAIQAALPMLLNGLANNASTPAGAQSLNDTLQQHHDGSILDNLGSLASA